MAQGETTMKKLLTLLFTLVLTAGCLLGLTACGDNNGSNGKQTITVYTESGFAPFEYLNENGEVVGSDIDLMSEICDILGYNLVVKDVAFGAILTNVQNDKWAVGAAGITVNAERSETGIFSDSYTTSVQYVIVKKGTFSEADLTDGKIDLTKLSGKKMGMQESTTGCWLIEEAVDGTKDDDGNHVKGELEGTGASYIEYKNAVVASNDIGGKIDAVVIDELPAKSICKNNSELECFQINAEPESYAFYLNKEATELLSNINYVLAKLKEDGVVDYLINKHSGAYNLAK